jgi:hypothetical protein
VELIEQVLDEHRWRDAAGRCQCGQRDLWVYRDWARHAATEADAQLGQAVPSCP